MDEIIATLRKHMLELADRLERRRDVPSLDEIRQQVQEWADALYAASDSCSGCEELHHDLKLLEEELVDAVDNFAEFQAWRQERNMHEGHPKDRPYFFKPTVDHEIGLQFGETVEIAKVVGRQICWEIEVEGKRTMIFLDADCRLCVAPFADGTEVKDLADVKRFVVAELTAVGFSIDRLQ